MSNTKKITKREKFEMLANIADVKANPMLVEFIEHELELLAKKNSSEKKPTSIQAENSKIKEQIIANMEKTPNQIYTITDMMKNFPCCQNLSNQKVSALVRQLKEDGLVKKFEDKRKSYFELA